MAYFNLDVLLLFKFARGPSDQLFDVADNLADVVGNASGGIRRICTALIRFDFKLRISAAGLGGRTHARGISSDD